MIVRSLNDVEKTPHFVDFGNGTSHRLLTKSDNMGFTVCHTIVKAGTVSELEYRNHLEACYCVSGYGEVEEMDGTRHAIAPGTLYALDKHDRHLIKVGPQADMVLVSVFNPPLEGTETHRLDAAVPSSY